MKYAGITYRQIDHWTRTGIIHTDQDLTDCWDGGDPQRPGTGFNRIYSDAETQVLRMLGALVRAGFSPVAGARVARQLVEHPELPVHLFGDVIVKVIGRHPDDSFQLAAVRAVLG
jgi:hypothetical protein